MKIGSKVKVKDGSWSLKLGNRRFEHGYGIYLANREFEVVHTDMKLPSTDDGVFNDTVIKDINNGEIVFIQGRFLQEIPKSQSVAINIKATINPRDIEEIKKTISELEDRLSNLKVNVFLCD